MRFSRSVCFFCVGLISNVLMSSELMAWGQTGHKMVNRVAIDLIENHQARQFLESNREDFVRFSVVPDTRWKSGPNAEKEKPLHWFEFDGYGPLGFNKSLANMLVTEALNRVGAENTSKYGMALWRTSQMFRLLVESLKQEDWQRALQVGGVMGHYIGDLNQPMHLTLDYDGQSINKPGIHRYYESTLVDKLPSGHLYDTVLPEAGRVKPTLDRVIPVSVSIIELQNTVYDASENGFTAVKQLINEFDQQNQDDQWLQEDLQPRIAYAAAMMAKMWDAAFHQAKVRKFPSEGFRTPDPQWVPLD